MAQFVDSEFLVKEFDFKGDLEDFINSHPEEIAIQAHLNFLNGKTQETNPVIPKESQTHSENDELLVPLLWFYPQIGVFGLAKSLDTGYPSMGFRQNGKKTEREEDIQDGCRWWKPISSREKKGSNIVDSSLENLEILQNEENLIGNYKEPLFDHRDLEDSMYYEEWLEGDEVDKVRKDLVWCERIPNSEEGICNPIDND